VETKGCQQNALDVGNKTVSCVQYFFLKKNHTYSFNPTPMMCKIERMSSKKIKFLQIKTNKSVKKFIFFVIAKL
jgi:hypothetical protein